MGDEQGSEISHTNMNNTVDGDKKSDSHEQVARILKGKKKKKKRGNKEKGDSKMEDKDGELCESTPGQYISVQSLPEEPNKAQSLPEQPNPPSGQPDRSHPAPAAQSKPAHPTLDHSPLIQPKHLLPNAQSAQEQCPLSCPTLSTPDEAYQLPPQSSPQQSSTDHSSKSLYQQSSADQPSHTSAEQLSLDQTPKIKPKKQGDPGKLTLLTWNIDGLDMEDIKERFSKLLDYLIDYHPDVVLLQEVISPFYQILKEVLKPYHVFPGNDKEYFTAILLRKSRVQLLESEIVTYPTTRMMRNLLMAHVSFLGRPLCVMTSHLESMKPNSQERLNQLSSVWKMMMEQPQDHTVIFGGDTNLRDWEVKKLGGLPDGICDVWESLGQPEDCRYTWDLIANDNKELPFPARLRFDRLFLRQANVGSKVSPDGMTLVGLERLDCGRFTSDHWGILCTFAMEKPLNDTEIIVSS